MREKYVKEGYKVVADPSWSSDGEYNFYEIIEICEDMVTLGELACEVRARQIPGTTQWKIKFIRVREKVINYMDISKSNLMGVYAVYNRNKKYSLIVDNNPGYDDWTSDYDSDSDTDSDYHSDNDSDSDSGYDSEVHKVSDYTKAMLNYMVSVVDEPVSKPVSDPVKSQAGCFSY